MASPSFCVYIRVYVSAVYKQLRRAPPGRRGVSDSEAPFWITRFASSFGAFWEGTEVCETEIFHRSAEIAKEF